MKIIRDNYGWHQQELVTKYGYLLGLNKYNYRKPVVEQHAYKTAQLQSEIYVLLI